MWLNKSFFLGKTGPLGFVGFCGEGAFLNKEQGGSRLLAAGLWPGSKPTHPTRRDPQGNVTSQNFVFRGCMRLKVVV